MRILHVTDTFLPKVGGAEIAIDQLIRAMTNLGADCTLLAQINRGHTSKVETPYPLHRFRSPQSSRWAGWWIRKHIQRLERTARGPFDVLIGHHAFPPGYACVQHARRTNKLAIVYPRGGDIYEVSRFRKKPAAWQGNYYASNESAYGRARKCGGFRGARRPRRSTSCPSPEAVAARRGSIEP